MATTPFPRRIGFHHICVAPATLLSDERDEGETSSLRSEASYERHCYLSVTKSLGDGTYLARVAANALHVQTQGFTIVLSEEQLADAIIWDCRTPERLRDRHARQQKQEQQEARMALCTITGTPKPTERRHLHLVATHAS